jgi:hypothetical protein
VTARLPLVLRPFTDIAKTEEEPLRLGVGGKETSPPVSRAEILRTLGDSRPDIGLLMAKCVEYIALSLRFNLGSQYWQFKSHWLVKK